MDSRSERQSDTRPSAPSRTTVNGVEMYLLSTDEQLIVERDRQQHQLDELIRHPAGSACVMQLATSIERDVDRKTEELLRRARARHPSSRTLSARLRFRSLPWPPSAD
ncbi:MAG: hypothetical protein ACLQPH_06870 [Acidimicrobiales bacterium]